MQDLSLFHEHGYPLINQKIKKDGQEEALRYDENSVGVFKKDETLVGHIPTALSNLIDYFLKGAGTLRVSFGCGAQKT